MYDYHIHTDFSGDCVEAMEDTILAAIKRGGKQVCFTDHLDYDYPTTEIEFDFDAHAFSDELERMQLKYGDQIQVQKGIEIGLQPHITEMCDSFIKQFKPDFVLCSFHVADRKDLYNGDFYRHKSPVEAWHHYFKDVLETLKKFKNYSVVGHLDIPKRYDKDTKSVVIEVYKEELTQVLKQIIKDGKGIEVNMSGLRTEMNETLPNTSILSLYHALGGQYITLGSDAHRKEDVYSHYYDVLKTLQDIGFKSFTRYENQEPIQCSIREALDQMI